MKNVLISFLFLLPRWVVASSSGLRSNVKTAKPVDVLVLTEALWYVRIPFFLLVAFVLFKQSSSHCDLTCSQFSRNEWIFIYPHNYIQSVL